MGRRRERGPEASREAVRGVLVEKYGADTTRDSYHAIYEACCNVAEGKPAGRSFAADECDCFGIAVDSRKLCCILNEATHAGRKAL